jgi:hypothetical protein
VPLVSQTLSCYTARRFRNTSLCVTDLLLWLMFVCRVCQLRS